MNPGDDTAPPPFRIEIEHGPSFVLGPQDDALLRGALRAGLPFPYECSVGGCGACRFELLEGEMDTRWAQAPGLSARDRQRGKRLACQSVPRSDCRIRVRLGEPEALQPLRARRSRARLLERRAITADLVELSLALADAPAFRPGQYAVFHLEGVAGVRAYSMSNVDDGSGLWRFIVRRTAQGQGSRALAEALPLGAELDLDGPYGLAHLRHSARDVVCVAGGSGLGPMLSVARGVLGEGGSRKLHFFLGLRHEAELAAAAELQTLAPDRVTPHVVLSAPSEGGAWRGATGFVHAEVERVLPAPLDRHDFYFAGPPPMVEAMQDLLMHRHRVPFAQIHVDRYV